MKNIIRRNRVSNSEPRDFITRSALIEKLAKEITKDNFIQIFSDLASELNLEFNPYAIRSGQFTSFEEFYTLMIDERSMASDEMVLAIDELMAKAHELGTDKFTNTRKSNSSMNGHYNFSGIENLDDLESIVDDVIELLQWDDYDKNQNIVERYDELHDKYLNEYESRHAAEFAKDRPSGFYRVGLAALRDILPSEDKMAAILSDYSNDLSDAFKKFFVYDKPVKDPWENYDFFDKYDFGPWTKDSRLNSRIGEMEAGSIEFCEIVALDSESYKYLIKLLNKRAWIFVEGEKPNSVMFKEPQMLSSILALCNRVNYADYSLIDGKHIFSVIDNSHEYNFEIVDPFEFSRRNSRQTNSDWTHTPYNERVWEAAMVALGACRKLFGDDNCKVITRILDDDGQVDIDLGWDIANFKPSPNSDALYSNSEALNRYEKVRIGRVMLCGPDACEIEGNTGNYYKQFKNTFELAASLKKHLPECFRF